MPTILAMNGADFDGFSNFGAAAQPVLDLQVALAALGKGVGDTALTKLVLDGLIGPETVAAANRALTVHLGAGQAPANLRTGLLSQAVVASQAEAIAALVRAEVLRRGFSAPVVKKVATVKKVAAPGMVQYTPAAPAAASAAPVYRVPAPAPSGMDMNAVIKWSAIGVGAVTILGLGYWIMTKKPAGAGKINALAGFAGRGGRRGPYKGKPSDFDVTVWEERDRLHIGVTKKGEPIKVDWWDDDARSMIEDGFFKSGGALKQSVLDYALQNGLIKFT